MQKDNLGVFSNVKYINLHHYKTAIIFLFHSQSISSVQSELSKDRSHH